MAAQKRKSTLRRRKTRHEALTQPQPSSFGVAVPASPSIPNNSSVLSSQSVGVQQPTPAIPNQPVDAQTLSQFPQESSPGFQPPPQTQPQSPAQPPNISGTSSFPPVSPVQNDVTSSFPQSQEQSQQGLKAQVNDAFVPPPPPPAPKSPIFEGMGEPPKKKGMWAILIVVVVILIIFSLGALYIRGKIMQNKDIKEKEEKVVSTPTQSSVVSPKPSPATESASLAIDSQYTIKILNGSGIRGEAAKAKELLLSEKFNVEEIDNAEASDYVKTIIRAKKSVPKGFLDNLRGVIEKSYVLDENGELSDSETVDVIVIIGSKKQ